MISKIENQLLMIDDVPKSKSLLWSKMIINDTNFYKNANTIYN